jgi:hypothetical protein
MHIKQFKETTTVRCLIRKTIWEKKNTNDEKSETEYSIQGSKLNILH